MLSVTRYSVSSLSSGPIVYLFYVLAGFFFLFCKSKTQCVISAAQGLSIKTAIKDIFNDVVKKRRILGIFTNITVSYSWLGVNC